MRGEFSVFRKQLLDWFSREKRSLPWRTDPSLYRTVVSEFMLQQTQVDTALPFFARWMAAFPDFQSLSEADEATVLKQWEGLGYYSRARNLHKLAHSIVAEGIPKSAEGWRQRPGIGPYTAAAISSIAQGLPEPVIDGNVIRVLTRLTNDSGPIRSSSEAHKRLLPLARDLIDHSQPGAFNEAVMELGATTCRKARPLCLLCPVRDHCEASAQGTQEALPVIVRKAASKRTVARLWAIKEASLLLHFYPKSATRLAGIAELPELPEIPAGNPLLTRSRGISSEQIRESIYGLPCEHAFTKKCQALEECRWVPIAELSQISLSAPHRRWIETLISTCNPSA